MRQLVPPLTDRACARAHFLTQGDTASQIQPHGTESSKTAAFLMANQRVFVSQYESFGVYAVAQETLQTDYKISSRLLGANQHSTFPVLVVHFYPAHLWAGRTKSNTKKEETCGADSHKQTSKYFERLFPEHVRSGKETEKDLQTAEAETAAGRDVLPCSDINLLCREGPARGRLLSVAG